jgi:hypothetical protein
MENSRQALDAEFALTEYRELRSTIRHLIDLITQTERFAVLGAAGAAAFSISGLADGFDESRIFISGLPFVVVSLGGLRCLTFYALLQATVRYIAGVEDALLKSPLLGFERHYAEGNKVHWYLERISGGYWFLAVVASVVFWFQVNF